MTTPLENDTCGLDSEPQVDRPRSGPSTTMMVFLGLAAAVAAIVAIEAHRPDTSETGAPLRDTTVSPIAPAAPLRIPAEISVPPRLATPTAIAPVTVPPRPAPLPPPQPYYPPPPAYPPPPPFPQPPAAPPRAAPSGSILVFDTSGGRAGSPEPRPGGSSASANGDETAKTVTRVRAKKFRNPGTTVAQGTLVAANLETALDSTRPGLARALVSKNVHSFDGSRILIPRGSRLLGHYSSDVGPGQKRIGIVWTRLIRPDGVVIDMESPTADSLGRGGIRGAVDSHFFERFGSAILQSVLDIGVNLAASRINRDTVIVGLPGSVANVARPELQANQAPVPTIKVRQGAAIHIFVAQDLDFTSVEAAPSK